MGGFSKDEKGRIFAVAWPTEGSKSTKVSHRWNDPTTWYQNAILYSDQACSSTVAGIVYQAPHTNLIDCFHGKIWGEETLGMNPVVKVDGVVKSEVDPHDGTGDFTINYATGVITFSPAISAGAAVTASYYGAGSSVFTVKPDPGKRLSVQSAEVQFSADMVLTDTVLFQLFGFVEVFAPQLLDTADPPGPYPAGTLIPLKTTTYKTMQQFIDESNGANPIIKALGGGGWRGMPQDVMVFPWNYQAIMNLDASKGMEIRISLEHDAPFGGSYATCTMYCLSEDEP